MRRTAAQITLSVALVAGFMVGLGRAHAEDAEITVGDPCEGLAPHEPAPDVAYQPGVDVEGNPVAPADVAGSDPLLGPDHEYRIPLEVPLEDVTDLDGGGSGVDLIGNNNVRVGDVSIVGEDVLFNGQPLGDQSAHALAEACARRQAEEQE